MKLVAYMLLFFLTTAVAYGENVEKRTSAEAQAAMERLEKDISVAVEKYNSRPRKQRAFSSTGDQVIDRYLTPFYLKLERVGALNYPQEARGKMYGEVTASFEIHANGAVRNIVIEKSSGQEILDRSVVKIIGLSSPALPFPPELSARVDILELRKVFNFTNKVGAGDL